MNLSKSIVLMLVLALVTGGIAAYLSDRYIADQVAEHRQQLDARYEPVKVVVASRDLFPGTVISSDTVSLRAVPKGYIHQDALRPDEFSAVAGLTLAHPLKAGETVLRSHLSSQRGGHFAGLIEDGKRALTLSVDDISSVSGMLQPNDRVDILMTTRDGKDPLTFPLIEDVLVLATGVKTDAYGEDGVVSTYNTATVLVGPKDSARLVHASSVGKLTFVLRGGDLLNEESFPAKVTRASLLGTGEQDKPAHKVEIIVGRR